MMFVSRADEENLIYESQLPFFQPQVMLSSLGESDPNVQIKDVWMGWKGVLPPNAPLFIIKDKVILYYSDIILPLQLVL